MAPPDTYRRTVMAERPAGPLALRHFRSEVVPLPPRPADAVLLRNLFVSVTPQARARMQGPAHLPRLDPGEVIPGAVVAEVVAAPPRGPAPGSVVSGTAGWQEYAVLPASGVHPLEPVGRLSHHLGLLGRNGLTAYRGIRDIARVRAGETVVVSGAAGGIGHLAGQLARIAGARVVGITGSDEKNAILRRELGFSAAVNRRSPSFADDLRAACPAGADVYFDTTGGPALDAVLPVLVRHGRIVCCGLTAHYDARRPPPGSADLGFQLIRKSLRMQGFSVADDHRHQRAAARQEMHALWEAGDLTALEDVRDGLAAAPAALIGMLAGASLGQLSIRLAPTPPPWPPPH